MGHGYENGEPYGNVTDVYEYSYYDDGNVREIKKNNISVRRYEYDALGQLTREDNADTGETVIFTYDRGGNLTAKKEYAITTIDTQYLGTPSSVQYFGYENDLWYDQLTSVSSTELSYDGAGNLTDIGEDLYLTWTQGHRLESYEDSGEDYYYSYTYNADGIRTSKTVNGVKHNYTLDGSRILSEEWTVGNVQHMMLFIYDAAGSPVGFWYRNSDTTKFAVGQFSTYIYGKNVEGDVIYIFNSSGTKVAEYTYDAWGNVTVAYISQDPGPGVKDNPFRYRGYYYDEETGWYYLQSRYYNPAWGRFISPDSSLNANGDLLGFNMYAYCSNNPDNRDDYNGNSWNDFTSFLSEISEKILEATFNAFQIEVGGGYGIGVSKKVGPIEAKASMYQDSITLGFNNGKSYTAIKGSAGVYADFSRILGLGISTEYVHRFETDCIRDIDEHDTFSAPWSVYRCPKTVKDPIQIAIPFIKPLEGNLSRDFVIGYSAEAHFGLGGHFSVGFNLSEFWRSLTN